MINGSGGVWTGKKGDDIAAAYLQGKGYRIAKRNYKRPQVEIDVAAKDGDTIVFL